MLKNLKAEVQKLQQQLQSEHPDVKFVYDWTDNVDEVVMVHVVWNIDDGKWSVDSSGIRCDHEDLAVAMNGWSRMFAIKKNVEKWTFEKTES